MALTKCFDASTQIPTVAPAGCGAVLGYIGMTGPERLDLALHVWTATEWDRFGRLRQFPCWVADLAKSAESSAITAVDLAHELGWRRGRAIVYDTENTFDAAWAAIFEDVLLSDGYVPVNYGSADVVAGNGCDLIWLADWNDDPILSGSQSAQAHQYAANVVAGGGVVDLSVVSEKLLRLGGIGPRR